MFTTKQKAAWDGLESYLVLLPCTSITPSESAVLKALRLHLSRQFGAKSDSNLWAMQILRLLNSIAERPSIGTDATFAQLNKLYYKWNKFYEGVDNIRHNAMVADWRAYLRYLNIPK